MKSISLALGVAIICTAATANAQTVLFDFNNGPQFTGTPLDQVAGGIRAHFTATGQGYSIQNTAQVIGVLPTGFSGLGLTPNSVFASDLVISFSTALDGSPQPLTEITILTAPQELACDSSATMRITAYDGVNLVGTQTAIAPYQETYTWPTITLNFASAQTFDSVVVHFESAPPTGGDYGVIFAADNLSVTPVPEPAGLAVVLIGGLALLRRK